MLLTMNLSRLVLATAAIAMAGSSLNFPATAVPTMAVVAQKPTELSLPRLGGGSSTLINQRCGDERDIVVAEYIRFKIQLWQPSCRDFTDTRVSTYFTWDELNGGFFDGNPHNPWGYVAPALITGLENLLLNYRGPVSISSGYRCPHGNKEVGSQYPATSRHMFGLAVDIRTGALGAAYDDLSDAAADAGAYWISEKGAYRQHIIHVHWKLVPPELTAAAAIGQRTQSELAEGLLRYAEEIADDHRGLVDLLHAVSSIPVSERGPELREALIETLRVSQAWSPAVRPLLAAGLAPRELARGRRGRGVRICGGPATRPSTPSAPLMSIKIGFRPRC